MQTIEIMRELDCRSHRSMHTRMEYTIARGNIRRRFMRNSWHSRTENGATAAADQLNTLIILQPSVANWRLALLGTENNVHWQCESKRQKGAFGAVKIGIYRIIRGAV